MFVFCLTWLTCSSNKHKLYKHVCGLTINSFPKSQKFVNTNVLKLFSLLKSQPN